MHESQSVLNFESNYLKISGKKSEIGIQDIKVGKLTIDPMEGNIIINFATLTANKVNILET